MPSVTYRNKELTASGKFAPARQGRVVRLQLLSGSSWVTVASGAESATGAVRLPIVSKATGAFSYRLVAPAYRGAVAKASSVRAVRVDPDPVQVSDRVEPLTPTEAAAIQDFDSESGQLTFASDAPAVVADLEVGDVVPVPPRDEAPSGALLRVTSRSTGPGGTVLETESVDLPEVVDNVPDDAAGIGLTPIGAVEVTDVAEGVTIEPANSPALVAPIAARAAAAVAVSVDGPPVSATVSYTVTQNLGGGAIASAQVSGTVKVTPGVEVGLDVDWGTVKYYKLGAYLKEQTSLTAKVSGQYAAGWEKSLFTVRAFKGGLIGPVPVWVQLTGTVKVKVSATGEVGASITWSRTDTSYAGFEGRNSDGLTPRPYQLAGTTSGVTREAHATGTVTGQAYGDAEIALYSAIGPFLRIGYEAVGTVTVATGQPLTCSLYHRPLASVGIRTSDDLKKLIKKQFSPFTHNFTFTKRVIAGCPGGGGGGGQDDPPSITTSALPPGWKLWGYASTLATADGRPGSWRIANGSLPQGIVLGANGVLSGRATGGASTSQFSVAFTDETGATAVKELTLEIKTPLRYDLQSSGPAGLNPVVRSIDPCPPGTKLMGGNYDSRSGALISISTLDIAADGSWKTDISFDRDLLPGNYTPYLSCLQSASGTGGVLARYEVKNYAVTPSIAPTLSATTVSMHGHITASGTCPDPADYLAIAVRPGTIGAMFVFPPINPDGTWQALINMDDFPVQVGPNNVDVSCWRDTDEGLIIPTLDYKAVQINVTN